MDGSWNAWLSNHRYLRKALDVLRLVGPNQGAKWNVRPLVHDLTKRLPFEDDSVPFIYGSHVLEHLYLADARRLLSECKRVLRAGGVIRLVVPDLHSMASAYLKSKSSSTSAEKTEAADRLNEKLGFRSPAPPNGNMLVKVYSVWKDFHHHKWMYDSESLIHYLELSGFQEVLQKEFCQSDIPGIEEVEDPERVLGGVGICIEGKKGGL